MVSKIIKQALTVDLNSFDNAYRIGLKAKKNFLTLDVLFLVTIFSNSYFFLSLLFLVKNFLEFIIANTISLVDKHSSWNTKLNKINSIIHNPD